MISVIDEKEIATIVEELELTPEGAAIPKTNFFSKRFEGTIVSMTGDKLVMSSQAGTEYSHTLAMDVNLTCDGTVCKAEDLKAGLKIRVTTQEDDRNVATGIESLNKNAEFTQCS